MKTEIIKEFDIDKIKEEKDATLVLGLFDGIHKGHQFLIKEALKNNDNVIILSLLKSFKNNEDVLLSLEDKEEILSSFNIKKLILLDNSLYFKNMTYLDFILKILKIINPKNIYVGNDYTFGKNGLGNVSILKKYFKVFTPNFYLVNNEKVSSTKIKEYIRNGEVEKANYMLNRYYFYKGTVIKGLQNGSKFLFPTINLSLLTNYVLLKNGVYQTQITIDGVIYDSITNIGVHPTIDKLSSPSIETFVLNFNN